MSTATHPSLELANPLEVDSTNTSLPQPCVLVIFGAAGDLSWRKLLPAAYNLNVDGVLPSSFAVVGFGLSADGQRLGVPGNRVYYLSIPPSLVPMCVDHLRESGLVNDSAEQTTFTRVIVEKPIGRDLESAREIIGAVGRSFSESQTYRIDHYLVKETVQNALVLRFAKYGSKSYLANTMFGGDGAPLFSGGRHGERRQDWCLAMPSPDHRGQSPGHSRPRPIHCRRRTRLSRPRVSNRDRNLLSRLYPETHPTGVESVFNRNICGDEALH